MDEPLSNLDAKLRVQMRTTVARLQNQLGTTTVRVTHDQTEAMNLGDRVAVMRAGVIQQVGAPDELYERPRNFLPGTLEDGRLRTALGDVNLPDDMRAKVQRAGAGHDLIVGIRPEHFEDAALLNGRRTEGITFSAVVDVLESLGADKYAYFHLKGARATAQELEELAADAGTNDAPGGTDQVVARLDPASRARGCRCGSTPASCTCSTRPPGPTSPSDQPAVGGGCTGWIGSSARREVPCPGRLSTRRVPPLPSTRSLRPMRPEPRAGSAPPAPSSRIASRTSPSSRSTATSTAEAPACLATLVRASATT
jgi:MalK OB fold domain